MSKVTLSVVDQVVTATRKGNRLPLALGAALGALAPITTYTASHYALDLTAPIATQPATYIVAGGLLFSAYSVVGWAAKAFRSPAKAIGFTVLCEGAMTFLGVAWLSWLCLAYLVAINAIAAGCSLALDRQTERAAARKPRARKATVTPLRKVG